MDGNWKAGDTVLFTFVGKETSMFHEFANWVKGRELWTRPGARAWRL
jgi:hypothetical protein